MGKSGGISQSTQDAEVQVAQGELAVSQSANQRAQQLFNTSYPGFQEAENYYQQLASGDPTAISRAIAPATEQISKQSQGAAQRITQDVPRGGAQNLALAENQINKGAQISQAATQGYLNSFQNLSSLAGQGVGESSSYTNSAISALGAAGNQYSNIAQQEAEGKASQLGFIASLAGSGGEAAAAFCWVAEALFGETAFETMLIRRYLTRYARKHPAGWVFCWLYHRYGERAAARVRRSMAWRKALQPIFNFIYRRGVARIPASEQREMYERHWSLRIARVRE